MVAFNRYISYLSGTLLGGVAFYYIYRTLFMTKAKKLLVDSTVKHALTLISKANVSHDTLLLRFELPSQDHVLGLPVGNCIRLNTEIDGENVARAYTPITSVDTKGHFDIIVKVYRANSHPNFPNGGKMSQYLDNCSVGDSININGPFGKIKYLGNGDFLRVQTGTTRKYSHVVMIAGGSGITPMLQIINNSLENPSDTTKFSVILANKTVRDILLRDEMCEMANKHPTRLSVTFAVDALGEGETGFDGHVGYVTEDLIRRASPVPSDSVFVMMCGPRSMVDFVSPTLAKMGYDNDSVFTF